MDKDNETTRSGATSFALEAYAKVKYGRPYAITPTSQLGLAAIAAAMLARRKAEGRSQPGAVPSPWQEFFGIVARLSQAGCNVLQARPGDAAPTPKPWLDPVTGEALPNPWDKTSPDLRAQSILQKRDPDLAEHYRSVAEDPYGTIARMKDAEAARTALEQVPYGENEHAVNPFRSDDLRAQSALAKSATPALTEFYKAEAKDVEVPFFGKSRNMTIEGRLAKDPTMAALVKVAQQIYETWRAQDKAEAQAEREQAEIKLKRLAEVAA
jgi:hypothetical protein